MGFEKLLNISLVNLIGHPEITARIEFLLLQKEAVVAIKVASRTRWLGHDVKSTGSII
jgi:Trk K+ transport system NAD-binding subunit